MADRAWSPSAEAMPSRPGEAGLKLCVCVATYRRPEGLSRLLDSLDRLEFSRIPKPQVTVVVVDNDPVGALPIPSIDRVRTWPVIWCREPRRGISHARNRCISIALKVDAELIAFIDDDEEAESGWLEELIITMKAENADVVTGPVLPRYENAPPNWIVRGDFFTPMRRGSGTRVERAYTGNVLLRSNLTMRFDGPFSTNFALSGGEDVDLFLRINRAGYKIVWSDDAIVYERQPAERLNAGWLLRRAFRNGNIWARLDPALQPSGTMATRALISGLLRLPGSIFSGKMAFVKATQRIALGLGYVAGRFGLNLSQYR